MHIDRRTAFWGGFAVAAVGLLGVTVAALAIGNGDHNRITVEQSSAAAGIGQRALNVVNAFQRQRRSSDALSAGAQGELSNLLKGAPPASSPLNPGTPDPGRSRRLMANLGGHSVDFFGVPTSKGQVCMVFGGVYGSPGCFDRFSQRAPISWDLRDIDEVGSGEPPIVDGLAPPSVTRIDVVVSGKTHSASLANGAFFYELPSPDLWPQQLVVTYSGLAPRVIDLGPPPTPIG